MRHAAAFSGLILLISPAMAEYKLREMPVDCDQDAARLCQQQTNGCYSICGGDQACNAGCINRYRECKQEADCQ